MSIILVTVFILDPSVGQWGTVEHFLAYKCVEGVILDGFHTDHTFPDRFVDFT